MEKQRALTCIAFSCCAMVPSQRTLMMPLAVSVSDSSSSTLCHCEKTMKHGSVASSRVVGVVVWLGV
jgi:hypothetical protein